MPPFVDRPCPFACLRLDTPWMTSLTTCTSGGYKRLSQKKIKTAWGPVTHLLCPVAAHPAPRVELVDGSVERVCVGPRVIEV